MIETLIDARKSRKRIISLLTKQQHDDSRCAERLKQVGLDGRRRLLELLATWLISFEPENRMSDADRAAFGEISPWITLEYWSSLQSREAALIKRKTEASTIEEGLYKVYDCVAPNGFLSILFMSSSDKAAAERTQQEYKSAKAIRESIENELSVVREDIQKSIGRFLRDATKPESLELLAKGSSIKKGISDLIQEAGNTGISIWEPHAREQLSSISKIATETENLSSVYSSTREKRELFLTNGGGK